MMETARSDAARGQGQSRGERPTPRIGDAVLSTARRGDCLFNADYSGGRRQFNWLWWTTLVSKSAKEGSGELVR